MWIVRGKNYFSNSSFGTGGTPKPSGTTLNGKDLPLSEPYNILY
jgi:hypothetical protein